MPEQAEVVTTQAPKPSPNDTEDPYKTNQR